MQQVSSIYLALIFIIAIIATNAAATRGCGAFGHSCFGGHGKRADIPNGLLSADNTIQMDKIDQNQLTKDQQFPASHIRAMNDGNIGNDNDVIFLRSDNDYRYDAVYSLLKKLMNDAQKAREMDTDNRFNTFRNNNNNNNNNI